MTESTSASNAPRPARKARVVIIMRHGQTDWNAEYRMQGRTDIPLNETGRAQARDAAPFVAALRPSRIVASPLSRAFDTAQAVGEVLGLPVVPNEGFVETDLGVWEGMTDRDVKEQYPEEIFSWRQGVPDQKAGLRGESKIDLGRRTTAALAEVLADTEPGSVTLVVMHGGASRALIGALMGLREEDWNRFEGLGNCGWSVLREDLPGVTLEELNAVGAAGAGDEDTSDSESAPSSHADDAGAAPLSRPWTLMRHNVQAPASGAAE